MSKEKVKVEVSIIDKKIIELKKSNKIKDIYVIEIEDKVAYLKSPNRKTLGSAMKYITNPDDVDMMMAGEIILRECFIGGDPEFLTDDQFLMSGALQAVTLLELKEATIRKK